MLFANKRLPINWIKYWLQLYFKCDGSISSIPFYWAYKNKRKVPTDTPIACSHFLKDVPYVKYSFSRFQFTIAASFFVWNGRLAVCTGSF